MKVSDAAFAVSVVGTKPDQKPLARGLQGEANAPWAMEWFLGQNLKVTVSPFAAVVTFGTNDRPSLPTTTVWSAARAEPASAVAVKMVEKRILIGCREF